MCSSDLLLDIMLVQSGLKPDDVKKELAGNSVGGFALIERGRLDAYITSVGPVVALREQGAKAVFWNTDAHAPVPGQVYIASREQAARNGDAVVRFLRAVRKSAEDMFADADLIGIPHRIVIGDKGLATQQFEYKHRKGEKAEMIPAILAAGGPADRPGNRAQAFAIGDRVRARTINPAGHTRLPRYARGHLGVVERLHGAHVYPDSLVAGHGEDTQWLYTVVFDGKEIWGPDTDPTLTVSIDAFEPYLEPA